MIWRCPRCRGRLEAEQSTIGCPSCGHRYEIVHGIPDLRINAPAWIDCEEDRDQARRIADEMSGHSVEQVVRHVFRVVRGLDSDGLDHRTQRVLSEPDRLRGEVSGWLDAVTAKSPFLDLGCGPGMLLAAASRRGRAGIGIDVSMVWLVVAQRMIESFGGTPVLAAGFAESLPLADGAVQAVVSLDVIEHVGDQASYLREIDRVTVPGGGLALATPNRFSLAAEPHVRVWGVGWLPRRWQQHYAEWRSGMPYRFTRLLSTWETRRLIATNTGFKIQLLIPPIPDQEIAVASPRRAVLARAYNALIRIPGIRRIALGVGAFFRVVGQKRGESRSRPNGTDGLPTPEAPAPRR